jgi:hypothetical protein
MVYHSLVVVEEEVVEVVVAPDIYPLHSQRQTNTTKMLWQDSKVIWRQYRALRPGLINSPCSNKTL